MTASIRAPAHPADSSVGAERAHRLSRASRAGLAAAALCALAGCTPSTSFRLDAAGKPPAAEARLVSYRGWSGCYRLSNGLVRVTNVPQVGGRTLEYALGAYNFLFVGHRDLGTTLDGPRDSRYRYFGGHFAQLHPTARWRGLQSNYPARLFMGRYTARIVPAERAAAIEMTSPTDLATGTRLVRRVELFAGSTHVRLTDTLVNARLVPQEWGIHDILQLKGYPTRSGILRGSERPRGALGLYVPLNRQSQFPGGVRYVLPERRAAVGGQWSSDRLPGLLTLRYRRQLSKVVVDPELPWIAFVDHRSDYVFVQTCRVPRKAIFTAGRSGGAYPLVEIQSLAPVARLEPGKSTTLVQDWYAARCPGPIVDVTPAGAVSSPLSLLRSEDGRTWVAGAFGVFYAGTAAVVFRDAQGTVLKKLGCGSVNPLRTLALNCPVDMPPGTADVTLEVHDADGKLVGHLGRILLASH